MPILTRPIPRTTLNLPTLGFGGAPLGGLLDAVDETEAARTLNAALDQGLSYVDTAPFYGFGKSERRVGDCLRDRTYILSTKVGRLLRPGPMANPSELGWPDALPFTPIFDYSYDGIMRSFEASFQRLGLDRIDILYVHDIGTMTHGDENESHFNTLKTSGYRALEELRSSGQVAAVGLGVNESAVCMDALEIGNWDLFLLAGRYTLLEQDPLADLLPACLERGTGIVIGGPYNSGILVGGDTWNYGAAPPQVLERVKALKSHCEAFNVPLPAAALQFPMGHPAVVSVIPGLRSRQELAQNLDWAKAVIPADFWQSLKDSGLVHDNAPLPAANPFFE